MPRKDYRQLKNRKSARECRKKRKIVVCNYERLHYFNEKDFEGVILDESSILKNFDGKIKLPDLKNASEYIIKTFDFNKNFNSTTITTKNKQIDNGDDDECFKQPMMQSNR